MSSATIVAIVSIGITLVLAIVAGVYRFGIIKNDTDRNKEEIDDLKKKVDNEVKDLYSKLEEKFDKLDDKIDNMNDKIENKFERLTELILTSNAKNQQESVPLPK